MGKLKALFTEAEDRLLKAKKEAKEAHDFYAHTGVGYFESLAANKKVVDLKAEIAELEAEEPEVGREWIERYDNPELSDSEREWLENEADYYGRYDLMDEYRREAELEADMSGRAAEREAELEADMCREESP